jgi:hypothetical protein
MSSKKVHSPHRATTYGASDAFGPFRKGLPEDDDKVKLGDRVVPERATNHTPMIHHVISLCGFEEDSVMMAYIDQEKWTKLSDVISIGINDVNDFKVRGNGDNWRTSRPLSKDLRMLQGFLMYFKRNRRFHGQFYEDKVLEITKDDFVAYCCSRDYHHDFDLYAVKAKRTSYGIAPPKSVPYCSTKGIDGQDRSGIALIEDAMVNINIQDKSDSDESTKGKNENSIKDDIDIVVEKEDDVHDDVVEEHFHEQRDGNIVSEVEGTHRGEKTSSFTLDDAMVKVKEARLSDTDDVKGETLARVIEHESSNSIENRKSCRLLVKQAAECNKKKVDQEHNKDNPPADVIGDHILLAWDKALVSLDDEGYPRKGKESNDLDSEEEEEEEEQEDTLNTVFSTSESPNIAVCVLCGTVGLPNSPCLRCCMFNKVYGDQLFSGRDISAMNLPRYDCSIERWSEIQRHGLWFPEDQASIDTMELAEQFWESEAAQEEQKVSVRREVNLTNIEFVRDIADSASINTTDTGEEYWETDEDKPEDYKIDAIREVHSTNVDIVKDVTDYTLGDCSQGIHDDIVEAEQVDGVIVEQQCVEFERHEELESDMLAPSIDDAITLLFVNRCQSEVEECPPHGIKFNKHLKKPPPKEKGEVAAPSMDVLISTDIRKRSKNIWLGDSGASCHMTNDDAGMFHCRQYQSMIQIGNGKWVLSPKIGNKKLLAVQKDGTTVQVVLHDVKFVPDLCINLFSITKALSHNWNLSNKGLDIILSQYDAHLRFDHRMKTQSGFVSGVEMFTITDHNQMLAYIRSQDSLCILQHTGLQPNRDHDQTLADIRSRDSLCTLQNMFCVCQKRRLHKSLLATTIARFDHNNNPCSNHFSDINYILQTTTMLGLLSYINIRYNDVLTYRCCTKIFKERGMMVVNERFLWYFSIYWYGSYCYGCSVVSHGMLHGDALTYKVLTKSNKTIYRSAIRSALYPAKRNQRLSPLGGETASNYLDDKIFIRSSTCQEDVEVRNVPSVKRRMTTIDPKDLIGRTFLKESEADGQLEGDSKSNHLWYKETLRLNFIVLDEQQHSFVMIGLENGELMMIAFENGELDFNLASISNHKVNQFFKESLSAIYGTAAILICYHLSKQLLYYGNILYKLWISYSNINYNQQVQYMFQLIVFFYGETTKLMVDQPEDEQEDQLKHMKLKQ